MDYTPTCSLKQVFRIPFACRVFHTCISGCPWLLFAFGDVRSRQKNGDGESFFLIAGSFLVILFGFRCPSSTRRHNLRRSHSRHTYCSNMAKSGMNPKTLQYLMGHSEIGVTMNTYTHLGLEDATEELRKMEEERAREEIFRGKQRQQETRLSPRMLRVVH